MAIDPITGLEIFAPAQVPSASSGGVSTQPRYLTATFGDGYEQRAALGLNNRATKHSLSWSPLTLAEKDSIVAFFEARTLAGEAFVYKFDSRETDFTKFVVDEGGWQFKTLPGGYQYELSATFREVYDIA